LPYKSTMELSAFKIGFFLAALGVGITEQVNVESTPNCDCLELMVAAIGDAGTQHFGKFGWYSRMFDENKRQYYWRRYSYDETRPKAKNAVWENDNAIWQVKSLGQRYWYIGALENRFQMNGGIRARILNDQKSCPQDMGWNWEYHTTQGWQEAKKPNNFIAVACKDTSNFCKNKWTI